MKTALRGLPRRAAFARFRAPSTGGFQRACHFAPARFCGEVPEWSNGAVSKTVVRVSVPRVRIPVSPPLYISHGNALRARFRWGGELSPGRRCGLAERSNFVPHSPLVYRSHSNTFRSRNGRKPFPFFPYDRRGQAVTLMELTVSPSVG